MKYCDWIFPRLEGNSKQHHKNELKKLRDRHRQVDERIATLSSDTERLNAILATIEKLFNQEHARKASIDTRLISIVGLVSVAGTVVLSALFALAAGTLPFPNIWVRSLLSTSCLYLTLQLFAALLAATSGVRRASYPVETALDLLPRPNVSLAVHLREKISQIDLLTEKHRIINNKKLSLLDVAHTALRNFLCGLLFLAFVAAVAAIFKVPQSQQSLQTCVGTVAMNCPAKTGNEDASIVLQPIPKIQLSRIITIGPFPEGQHQLDRISVVECVAQFFEQNRDLAVSGWQVIGRVDKRQLRPDLVSQYGSNQSLAMSRAAWVHDEVLTKVPNFDPNSSLVSVGGATSIGKNVTADRLKSDRVVDVYAFWQSSSQLRLLPAKLVPAICTGQLRFR